MRGREGGRDGFHGCSPGAASRALEGTCSRADQGMEESAGGVTRKLRVEGGERTRSLGVGGRTRASEQAGSAGVELESETRVFKACGGQWGPRERVVCF